jgi:hypothetical protein
MRGGIFTSILVSLMAAVTLLWAATGPVGQHFRKGILAVGAALFGQGAIVRGA